MKTMKFKGFKAKMIVGGEKSASLRLFDDKNFQKGEEIELINSDTGEIFANAIITEVIEKPLREITNADLDGHEPYKDENDMYASMKKYYGDRVNPQTQGKIIRFRIVD